MRVAHAHVSVLKVGCADRVEIARYAVCTGIHRGSDAPLLLPFLPACCPIDQSLLAMPQADTQLMCWNCGRHHARLLLLFCQSSS
jgi:hypothetical protein